LNPGDARVINNLGVIYLDQRQLDQAADCFREALRINPEFAEAEAHLGLVALQRRDIEGAISHFERALRSNLNLDLARAGLRQLRQCQKP
jgi:tetratricopeptide (TPR) repeat protein